MRVQLRLGDLINGNRSSGEACGTAGKGCVKFGEASEICRNQAEMSVSLKPSAKISPEKSIEAWVKS